MINNIDTEVEIKALYHKTSQTNVSELLNVIWMLLLLIRLWSHGAGALFPPFFQTGYGPFPYHACFYHPVIMTNILRNNW